MPTGLTREELNALIEVGKTVTAHLDLDTVLETVMAVTMRVMGVRASSLVLVDDAAGDLLFHVARGAQAEAVKPMHMKPGEGVVGWVIASGKPAIVNDAARDERFCKRLDDSSGFNTQRILCVPLCTGGHCWGAIEVLNKADRATFDDHDLQLCEAIASQAAIAIENAKLHESMLESERLAAIGQTVAGTAHCIKNLLNGIHGGAYMLDLALTKDDRALLVKGWDMVKRNNGFLQELVLDMLTYSKEREPEYVLADINEIGAGVCELMGEKGREKGVTITFEPCPALGGVPVDPKGIKRCLLNLVSNAVDACESTEKGFVAVRADVSDEDAFCISVSDTGCGIPDDAKERLFQVFFSTKGSKGTGLGLAVTHKIVTEHQGTLDVDSEAGRGTTFTMTLPLRPAAASSETKTVAAETS